MKKEVDVYILYRPIDEWTREATKISQIKNDIEQLEQLGATHIELEYYSNDDCGGIVVHALCRRLETDGEYESRKRREAFSDEEQKIKDLYQLEQIKKKYNLL